MGARPRSLPKSRPPTRISVYLTREEIGAALEREAKASGLSLSQTASGILERGLRGRVQADPDDRLLALERRVAEQGRRAARDLIIIEEMLFIALRTLFSRMPEASEELDPAYRGAVDRMMQGAINEVAERLRTTRLGREAARSGEPANLTASLDGARPDTPAANDTRPTAGATNTGLEA